MIKLRAQEARERADKVNTTDVNDQYVRIMTCIERAVQRGEYKFTIFEAVLQKTKEKLWADGYVVGATETYRDEISNRRKCCTIDAWNRYKSNPQ